MEQVGRDTEGFLAGGGFETEPEVWITLDRSAIWDSLPLQICSHTVSLGAGCEGLQS